MPLYQDFTYPWTPLFDANVNLVAATAGTYVGHQTLGTNQVVGTAWVPWFHYIDPADYAVTGMTMKMRVVASFFQSTTANAGASVATAGLYPTVPAGTTTVTATLGTVIAGSTAAKTGGAASAESRTVSSTFTAPAADTYTLAVVISVATTAGATRIPIRLEYRME